MLYSGNDPVSSLMGTGSVHVD